MHAVRPKVVTSTFLCISGLMCGPRPKLLQKILFKRNCFGTSNFVKITKQSLYKANYFACSLANRDKPVAATLQRKCSGGIKFAMVTKIITKNIPRNYVVIISARMLGSDFGRTDFSRIFIFGPPDFFVDFVAGFFLLIFVGKSGQKNPPGKSPAKSSKIYTTKIPETFLQIGQGKGWYGSKLEIRND